MLPIKMLLCVILHVFYWFVLNKGNGKSVSYFSSSSSNSKRRATLKLSMSNAFCRMSTGGGGGTPNSPQFTCVGVFAGVLVTSCVCVVVLIVVAILSLCLYALTGQNIFQFFVFLWPFPTLPYLLKSNSIFYINLLNLYKIELIFLVISVKRSNLWQTKV